MQKQIHRDHSDRLSIGVLMLIIAGAALGLWLVLDQLRLPPDHVTAKWVLRGSWGQSSFSAASRCSACRFCSGRPAANPGGQADFSGSQAERPRGCSGPRSSTTGLQARGPPGQNSMSGLCFFYGTPLMAVYVTVALLAKGSFRRSTKAPDAAVSAGDVRAFVGSLVGLHRVVSHRIVLHARLLEAMIRLEQGRLPEFNTWDSVVPV